MAGLAKHIVAAVKDGFRSPEVDSEPRGSPRDSLGSLFGVSATLLAFRLRTSLATTAGAGLLAASELVLLPVTKSFFVLRPPYFGQADEK